ncbi:predicted acyltransferase [Chthonomonas calidirosea]|uniref:Predicted acyltransferase n=1 Tax=Chthonomonas calidirosea (strain DSM 23976 / ICMP 18418 / T49) TaxID=1303518 RepID=S0EXG5_CHTCT|nr:GNAT family N-acetyltransferase [Chthonomonas calidirosea]CCW36173.1 Predicted acyltransferase [Chthonomonas calidirosea T49]CEK18123.1 predicted acyltransferase [Chthonomonas calidirosea]
MDYEVICVETSDLLREAFAVRLEVFVKEQGVPEEEELDVYDAEAVHFIAKERGSNKVIGTARLIQKSPEIGKIGRVAVLPDHRGRGVGTQIMQVIESFAHERNLRYLELDAQLQAIPFYERLGYTASGDIFLDAGIQHRKMTKTLHRAEKETSTT